jgi:hypothetical protein
MSDLPPPPPPPPPGAMPPPPPPAAPDPAHFCPTCGAPVRPDQDWCLNCGAAVTTQVASAGGWRTPIMIVAAVLLIAAAALVFAFVELSGEADKVAEKPPVTGPSGTTGPTGIATVAPTTGPTGVIPTPPTGVSGPTGPIDTATPVPTSTGGSVGSWPKGKTAYTVILFSETTRSSAKSKAQTVSSLPKVGILNSSHFSTLRGGYFVVFSGQYDTLDAAQDAAKSAASQAPGAYAKQVKPK